LRHTFVARLAENAAVSEETIRSLAGHMSKQILQRYSRIHTHAKQAAIAAMEQDAATLDAVEQVAAETAEIASARAQNRAQSRRERLHYR
jgi:uncharacterized protein YbjQ (UPF0145 family)